MKKIIFLLLAICALNYASNTDFSLDRYTAKNIQFNLKDEEIYYFPLPVAINYDSKNIFVLDSRDSQVKVFSKSGDYEYSFGKRGQGPGEFSYPSDFDLSGGRIYIADKLNRRVQILDKKGNYQGGFKVLFYPQNILVLENKNILVSHLPLTSLKKERIVHCFDPEGKLIWEGIDSFCSGDNVYDVFANQIFLRNGGDGSFYLVKRFNDRNIYLYGNNGGLNRKIKVDEKYKFKKILIPTKPNQKKELRGFCWFSTYYEKNFFLLMPEYSEKEQDLIPGKEISIINQAGGIKGLIELPNRIRLFCIDKNSVYGIDTLNNLRIFSLKSEKKGD